MTSTSMSTTTVPRAMTWPLTSFAVGKDAKSIGRADLFLDRANAELGFVRYTAFTVATAVTFPDTGEPVYFSAKDARAAAWREKSRKVCILFQHLQIDLEFESSDVARDYLTIMEDLTIAFGNHFFYSYEVPNNKAFMTPEFDMIKSGYTPRAMQPWMVVPTETSEWPRLRKTGEWADFTIVAQDTEFPVHRVKICKESSYFKAVCTGGFVEASQQVIELPEPARIVNILLDEIYTTYNPITASIFTGFALRVEIEKEYVLNQLFALFVAADKYNLEKIKRKAADAIIDRLPFVMGPLTIVELASSIHSDDCPPNDRGLRTAVIAQIQSRLSSILHDENAWQDFASNKVVLKAFHTYQCEMPDSDSSSPAMITPPTTPTKKGGAGITT